MNGEQKVTESNEEPSRVIRWFEKRLNLTEFFSTFSILGLFYSELNTHLPLRVALREALSRPLPAYARWPRILGPMSLLVLFLQVVSGILLAFYYQPTPATAHASIRMIVSEVPLGWFVHQIHAWGSTLLILILMLRLVRLACDHCFSPPRELLWISGVLLLLLAMYADFTGLLLVWSDSAYWTTVRGMEVITAIPVAGYIFSFLVGGATIGELTMTRFYVIHLALLPMMLLAISAIGFATVRRVGLSEIASEIAPIRESGYRSHLLSLVIVALLLFAGLVTMAVLSPLPFHEAADPLRTPASTAPPWYMLAPHAILELGPGFIPRMLRGSIILLMQIAMLSIPFLIGRRQQPAGSRWGVRLIVAALGLIWLALTVTGAVIEGWSP